MQTGSGRGLKERPNYLWRLPPLIFLCPDALVYNIYCMIYELRSLAIADKKDRDDLRIDVSRLIGRDRTRRQRASELVRERRNDFTAFDWYCVALIFHHGPGLTHSEKARVYARRSFETGYMRGRWLYAAATDRSLVRKGKPQRYGTQSYRRSPRSRWRLYRMDPTVTDAERRLFNVDPISRSRALLDRRNKRPA